MTMRPRRMMFVLVLVGLLTSGVSGCYRVGAVTSPDTDDSDTETETDTDNDTDSETDTETETETDTDTEPEICEDGAYPNEYTVESPPDGTPATPFDICTPGDEAVESNLAARVSFNIYSADLHLATGHVVVPEEIRDLVVGIPQITISEAYPSPIADVTISNIVQVTDGYSFEAQWPSTTWFEAGDCTMTVVVTMEITCEDETDGGLATKMIESTTYVHLCNDFNYQVNWVSSGGLCTVCEFVCEMAPSPIVPEPEGAPSALPRAVEVEIVPFWRSGRTLALVAEHRGTDGPVEYAWSATGGTVSQSDLGGVVWEIPKTAHYHQLSLVVRDRLSAAVATFRYRHTM